MYVCVLLTILILTPSFKIQIKIQNHMSDEQPSDTADGYFPIVKYKTKFIFP